jgi:hypothetical protein
MLWGRIDTMPETHPDDHPLFQRIVSVVAEHFKAHGGGGIQHARAIFKAAKTLEWISVWLINRHYGDSQRVEIEIDRLHSTKETDSADEEASELAKIVIMHDTSGVKPCPESN